ncbi:hypothetical protein AB6W78_04610 [Pasteurella multocida]|nr:hypothetical protein [Pasteurella multocida]MDX3897612.1 hypothetical protein [Pasteurella multocida]MDX3950133.1 hypothetical protein [Pasteurella multocida]MDX3980407.1 hypothetical protein [Pasteurella multocida]MDX3989166.1 hypothetical protein [Pasteurella multocida]
MLVINKKLTAQGIALVAQLHSCTASNHALIQPFVSNIITH